MKKYIDELKQVTWPEGKEVNHQFWVTIFGVIFLIGYFILTDTIISNVLDVIYNVGG